MLGRTNSSGALREAVKMKSATLRLGGFIGCFIGSLLAVSLRAQSPAASLGAVNVGASATATVTLTISSAATLGNIAVVTQGATGLDFTNAGGGSCTKGTSYSANSTCTVIAAFTPKFSGARYGAVQLSDNNGNLLATAYLTGTGTEAQLVFLPGTQSVLTTSALNGPQGIAVDASGNVYISDTGNSRVLKETLASGSYSESEIGSGLSSPTGIAVDGTGNVYIADSGNNRILIETLANGSYTQGVVVNKGLYDPFGVAVDASGNVYVADTYNNRLLKETPNAQGYTQTSLNDDLYEPNAVAVDGAGNVYIADTGNWRAIKLTLQSNGYYSQSPLGCGLNRPHGISVDGTGIVYIADGEKQIFQETPSGHFYAQNLVANNAENGIGWVYNVAEDGSGNLYITDEGNDRIVMENLAAPPTLSFSSSLANEAGSSGELTATVVNIGNESLTLPVPATGTNPSVASSFTVDQTVENACPQVSAAASSAAALAAGQFCTLAVGFDPAGGGTVSGTLVLTDNNRNAAAPKYVTQSIQLLGQGPLKAQTITFPYVAQTAYQYAATLVPLNATATSGLAVSYGTSTPSVCTVAQSGTGAWSVSLLTYGNCTLNATQPGNAAYAAAPLVSQTFWVYHAAQSITFSAVPSQVVNVPLTLNATASSGLAVSYTSTTTSICTVSGATATLLAAGTCTLQANQAGNATYAAAAQVAQSFSVAKSSSSSSSGAAPQTITFSAIATQTAGTPLTLSATASSGLAVKFASATPTICTISGSSAALLTYGTCSVTASQPGNSSFAAAKSITQSFTIRRATQTITFTAIPAQTLGTTLTLTATATSGLAVKYTSSSPTICTVSGATATLLAYGSCNLTATQPGNGVYAAAANVQQSFAVHHKAQTITFAAISSQKVGGKLTLAATASSGLAVSYLSTTPTVCTVSGSTATLLAAGKCTIEAEQAGNAQYAVAPTVTQSFTVTK
jgi:sugar lactone lactonase YvrE